MSVKYNLDAIFKDLENQFKKQLKKNNQQENILDKEDGLNSKFDVNQESDFEEEKRVDDNTEELENEDSQETESIESPEDAPETQEVAPATSKTTEDVHGGDEASKEINDSPNSAEDGEKTNVNNEAGKTKNSGTGCPNAAKFSSNEENSENKNMTKKEKDETNLNKHKNEIELLPEDIMGKLKEYFENKQQQKDDLKTQNRKEYLKKYIVEIIKKIAAQHSGIDKEVGTESYDKKAIAQHILKHQNYKILGDKYDLKDAKYVQFFIDTSGVYGCGSNRLMQELMPEIIGILEKQGYECYIASCGNGFSQKDMVDNPYYRTRKTLEDYKAGIVNDIACPCAKTAAKMANEAEFSIIFADFDGLSSICEMANLCQKDKVPYFLSTEDRYPWEQPELHNWVDPELCEYDLNLVYDVSFDGNPTLSQYEESLNYDDEYDDDHDYYDDEYDDEYDDDHEYDD